MTRQTVAFFVLAVLALPARGADWPRWRGPGGLGVSPERGLPVAWSAEKGLRWRIELPGRGNSSPVVIGDRLYVTAQTGDEKHHVVAVDVEKGAIAWDRVVSAGSTKAHKFHNMATPTPVADGDRVWALFGTGDLVCLDRSGAEVWRRQVQEDHGEYVIQWGMGTSPVLHAGRLFITCMQDGPSYVLGVDGGTGKDAWKTPRTPPSTGEAKDSYSTPILLEREGRVELVVCGADHVDAYDPATGKQLWISGGLEVDHPYGRSVASPAAADDVIVAVSSGFQNRGHLMALRTGGAGDVSGERTLWTRDRYAPDCPTPVCYQGLVYVVDDKGIGSCLDLRSGEVKWQKRLLDGDTKVSPVAGDGKVYFTSASAACVVVAAGPEGSVLATNELEGSTLSTPAISGGRLYFRTDAGLFAIGKE